MIFRSRPKRLTSGQSRVRANRVAERIRWERNGKEMGLLSRCCGVEVRKRLEEWWRTGCGQQVEAPKERSGGQ